MSESIIQLSVFTVLSCPYSSLSSLLILPLLLFHPPPSTPPPNTTLSQEDSPLGVWASNCICSCEETCEVLQTVYSKCQLKTRIPALLMNRAVGLCLWKAHAFRFCILLHAYTYISTAFIALATKLMFIFHNVSFGAFAVYGYKLAQHNRYICIVFAMHIEQMQHPEESPMLDLFWMDTYTQDTILYFKLTAKSKFSVHTYCIT